MACDIQSLSQAIVYFVICVLNFVVAIPLGITLAQFDCMCTLFSKVIWTNATHFEIVYSNFENCTFPIYAPVVLIFWTLLLGSFYVNIACKNNVPDFWRETGLKSDILLSTLIVILMLAVCCVIHVGLQTSCDSFLKGRNLNISITKCADIETYRFITPKVDPGHHFYGYAKISEVAGWIAFLMWVVQLILCIVRFVRNRRRRPTT